MSNQQTATLIWSDDFSYGNAAGWQFINDVDGQYGNWFFDSGYLVQNSNIGSSSLLGTHAVAGLSSWDNYTVSANIVGTDDDYIGLIFRYQDSNNYYRIYLSSQVGKIRFEKRINGVFQSLGYKNESWPYCGYNITVDAQHDTLKIYLNNKKYFDVIDNSISSGKVGFLTMYNNGSFFNDISVYEKLDFEEGNPDLAIIRGPYMQNVLGDSAVVMWKTNLSSGSFVEYGKTQTMEYQAADFNKVTQHEIVLNNLDADTEYFYRIYSDTLMSDWYSFRSAKEESAPFRFAVCGDNRTNFLRHREVMESLEKSAPNFIINVGDVVQYGLRADWDAEFFEPMSEVLTSTPVFVSIGNHEKESSFFNEYFSYPNENDKHYYSFKYGNAFFVIIDNSIAAYPTNTIYPGISEGSEQYNWLDMELASDDAQNAEWLIVSGHVPIYTAGSNSNYDINREALLPLFEDYGVDVYFTGHIHDYERGYSKGTYHVVTGGAGGPLDYSSRDIPEIIKLESKYHHCVIDINDNKLSFAAYDNSDTIFDEFEIIKDVSGVNNVDYTVPGEYALNTYPNPFNSSTIVHFTLPGPGKYSLNIFNIQGQLVNELAGGTLNEGDYWVSWEARNNQGQNVPSGMYLVVFTSGGITKTSKMLLIR